VADTTTLDEIKGIPDDKLAGFFQTRRPQTDLNQAEDMSPARFFAPSGPAIKNHN
jgi:hypothetical protein